MLTESIIDMPFSLSNRQSEMIFYIFNNIEVNNKLCYMIRTYDHDFWIPRHVQKIGDQYLKENAKAIKKRRTVKVNSEILMGEIEFHDENNFTLTECTHLNPNSPVSLPGFFEKTFISQYTSAKYDVIYNIMGEKFSKKGLKGTVWENSEKSSDKYKELFREVQKDLLNHVVKK